MNLTRSYKETAAGVIPADWNCTTVGAAAAPVPNAIVGGPFGSDLVSKDYVADGVPVIRGQNMGAHEIHGPFAFVAPAKADSLSANIARPGDVVFTQRGTLGQVSLVPAGPHDRYLVSQSQMKVTLNSALVDARFLHLLFSAPQHQRLIQTATIQTGVPHINLGVLKAIPVQLPPLPEQKAIAAALSDVDALLGALDRLIAKKRDLKQAAMQQLLTGQTHLPGFSGRWETRALRDLCVKIQDGTHFSPRVGGSDFLYITSKNIRFGTLDLSTAEAIAAAEHAKIYARCDVKKGDLLLTKDGVNTGNAALNPLNAPFSLLSSVAFLRFDNELHDPSFFLQQILSGEGQRQIKDLMAGNAITRLTLAKIRSLRLAYPSRTEQEAIAGVLSDMDTELAALEQRRDKTRLLKQGMMQELLTGRTRLV